MPSSADGAAVIAFDATRHATHAPIGNETRLRCHSPRATSAIRSQARRRASRSAPYFAADVRLIRAKEAPRRCRCRLYAAAPASFDVARAPLKHIDMRLRRLCLFQVRAAAALYVRDESATRRCPFCLCRDEPPHAAASAAIYANRQDFATPLMMPHDAAAVNACSARRAFAMRSRRTIAASPAISLCTS